MSGGVLVKGKVKTVDLKGLRIRMSLCSRIIVCGVRKKGRVFVHRDE